MTRRREAGFSLVALMASITIMLIVMSAAVPTWRYVMQDDREEELIFRGGEIADSIKRYQKKNANTLPTSLEMLVKGKFLRRPYKDPMMQSGRWRFIRQGEGVPPPGGGGPKSSPSPTPRPEGTSGGLGANSLGGPGVGPIIGVASTSTEKSLRVFNGKTRYNDWLFVSGQPRVVGKPLGVVRVPGAGASPGASPAIPATPTPSPPPFLPNPTPNTQ